MGLVVIVSNYLVQFPLQFYELENLLTYGAFSYPITFLITDLANRAFGKKIARQVILVGFFIGIILTLFVSTNFDDVISIRIAIGSATAFFIAQNLDVNIFDKLRKKVWYIAPLISSIFGSIIDTFLFFNCILQYRHTLVYLGFRRSCCQINCSINYANTFQTIIKKN